MIPLEPFQEEILLFCEALSQRLFQEKQNPDYVALAFWLRRTHLYQLQQTFLQKLQIPRGVVFHIPPANIDVMLVYSWACSLLVGNCNIVRIPTGRGEALLSLILPLLDQFPLLKERNQFLSYGHDEEMTRSICSKVDARVIWGGDETIKTLRQIPIPPHAVDVAFPDRFSFAVINAARYQKLNRELIANQFFNDMYWFDQSACSSPRLIFWLGEEGGFYETLQQTIEKRHYRVPLSGVLTKKSCLYERSLALPVEKVVEYSNELSVLYLKRADAGCRIHCGQGLLYHVPISSLEEIAAFTTNKDQTMTYCGFSVGEMQKLAPLLKVTRIVPFGQALNFESVWDGQDLLSILTKQVVVA